MRAKEEQKNLDMFPDHALLTITDSLLMSAFHTCYRYLLFLTLLLLSVDFCLLCSLALLLSFKTFT